MAFDPVYEAVLYRKGLGEKGWGPAVQVRRYNVQKKNGQYLWIQGKMTRSPTRIDIEREACFTPLQALRALRKYHAWTLEDAEAALKKAQAQMDAIDQAIIEEHENAKTSTPL